MRRSQTENRRKSGQGLPYWHTLHATTRLHFGLLSASPGLRVKVSISLPHVGEVLHLVGVPPGSMWTTRENCWSHKRILLHLRKMSSVFGTKTYHSTLFAMFWYWRKPFFFKFLRHLCRANNNIRTKMTLCFPLFSLKGKDILEHAILGWTSCHLSRVSPFFDLICNI